MKKKKKTFSGWFCLELNYLRTINVSVLFFLLLNYHGYFKLTHHHHFSFHSKTEYTVCLNIHGINVITNKSTTKNVVFFFVSDLKIE